MAFPPRGKGERKGSALRAIAENGISESTTAGGAKGAAVLDRDSGLRGRVEDRQDFANS